jgi:hypothetical protein
MSRHAVARAHGGRWRAGAAGFPGRPAAHRRRSLARPHRPWHGRAGRGTDNHERQQRQRRHQPDQSGAHAAYRVHARPPSTSPAPAPRARRRTSRQSAPPAAARPCPPTAASRGAGNNGASSPVDGCRAGQMIQPLPISSCSAGWRATTADSTPASARPPPAGASAHGFRPSARAGRYAGRNRRLP